MPTKRSRAAANREIRPSRLTLFVQQFEKEAQERMNELEAKLENMLATVDKVFKVELMKMPPALQNTRIGDLMSEEEMSASELSIAMKSESLQVHQVLRRLPSKRGKCKTSAPDPSPVVQTSSSKSVKGGKGARTSRTLAGRNSTGNLRSSSTVTKRSQSRVTKNEQSEPRKPRIRSVFSTGDLHCSMAASAAHVTVTTGRGQTVSFSEENKDEINVDLLDDVAWCQIHKLTNLMQYLSSRSRCDS